MQEPWAQGLVAQLSMLISQFTPATFKIKIIPCLQSKQSENKQKMLTTKFLKQSDPVSQLTCKSWHTVTPVAPIQIVAHPLVLTRVRGTLVGFGLTSNALIASRTRTCILVDSILTLASV